MFYHRYIKSKFVLFIPLLLVIAIIAIACGGDDPTATPSATSTPQPTAAPTTPPTPMPTLMPGETPQPTNTPVAGSTATPEPVATATVPPPLATLVPTVTPPSTPTPSGPQPKQGGILNMMIPYGPFGTGFDPYSNGWNPAYLNSPMYNELIHYNPETPDPLDIVGDIAKGWGLADDGLSYTFFLNENARWHDGTPVTAADIQFSLDDMVNPDKVRPWQGLIRSYYKDSEIINDTTIKVNLKYSAAAFFPYLALDYMQMLPKHHVETGIDLTLAENQLGSGPFKLKEYIPDVSIEYTRNTDYWKPGLPRLDGLRYFIISSSGTVTAAAKTKQILMTNSMVTHMTNAEALQLGEQQEGNGEGRVLWAGPASHVNLRFNTDREPFTDVRVRRAMHLALHRQPMIEILTRGQGTLGYPFAPNYWFSIPEEDVAKLPGYRQTADGEKHPDDLAEAKRLMAAAGFADGFQTEIMANPGLDTSEAAQIISDQLRRTLNIDMTIDQVDTATVVVRRNNRDYLLNSSSSGLLVIDPEDMIGRVYLPGGPSKYNDWVSPRVNELFKVQSSSLDRAVRKQAADEVAQIILEEVPTVGLYFVIRPMYVSSIVQNFNISPTAYTQNYKYEHLWCDPSC